ncbi:MAG: hypothetical protein CBE21_01365 [Proteobacteria bacterium TMED261]|nr:MAG: hypothetical protein CBE21_01365 [Proteobacteria bacterium TMED261]
MHILGPAGKLEYEFNPGPEEANQTFAVLCHPHPLYGGSMHDAVLRSTESKLIKHGISCIRFNFRGVGSSEGKHDNGVGEMEDLKATVSHFRALFPQKNLWTIGYSFGASVVWKTIPEIKPEKALLIAPPTKHLEFNAQEQNQNVAAIVGDQDEFFDNSVLEKLNVQSLNILEGGDHFFTYHHQELKNAVEEFITI